LLIRKRNEGQKPKKTKKSGSGSNVEAQGNAIKKKVEIRGAGRRILEKKRGSQIRGKKDIRVKDRKKKN